MSSRAQLDLARHVRDGCSQEGLVGLTFSTVGVRYVFPYFSLFWCAKAPTRDVATVSLWALRVSEARGLRVSERLIVRTV